MYRHDFKFDTSNVITSDRFFEKFPKIYCKTDFLFSDGMWRGRYIKALCEIGEVLVIGHSDYEVNDFHLENLKQRSGGMLKYIFAINGNSINPHLIPLPLGICNSNEGDDSFYYNYKIFGDLEQMKIVSNTPVQKVNKVYLNISTNTFPSERNHVISMFRSKNWVTYKQPTVSTEARQYYLLDIKQHDFVLCPRGNGIDTHRLWETLYMGSIPIVIYSNVHKNLLDLPILFIQNWEEVTEDFLEQKLKEYNSRKWNMDKLNIDYWIKEIESKIESKINFKENNNMKIFVVNCDTARFIKMISCSLDNRLELIKIETPKYEDDEIYRRGKHDVTTPFNQLVRTACLIGHMRAMKTFIETTNQDSCIIAEDNIRLHKNFFEISSKVLPLMEQYDILSLGFVNKPHGPVELFNGVSVIKDVKIGNPWGTQCYAISRKFAVAFLNRFDKDIIGENSGYTGTLVSDWVIHDVSKRVSLCVQIAIEEPTTQSSTSQQICKCVIVQDFYTEKISSCLRNIKDYEILEPVTRELCQKISNLYFEIGDVYNSEKWAMRAYNIECHPETFFFLVKYFRESGQHYKAMHYYNLIKNTTDEEYSKLLKSEYIFSNHYVDNDKMSSAKMIVNFVNNHGFKPHSYNNNLEYYLPKLASLFGSKKITVKIDSLEFSPSSISLVFINDKLIGNMRLVNYKLTNDRQFTFRDTKSPKFKTRNVSLTFNPITLDVQSISLVNDLLPDLNQSINSNILGLEDIRLFYNTKKNELSYSASTKEYSYNDSIRIVVGKYNVDSLNLEFNNIIKPPTETTCEKNWIFIDDNVIYSWYPMKIGSIVDNKLNIHTIYDLPAIFDGMRGSTSAVRCGTELWCITHSVTSEPRKYYHYLVVLNDKLKPIRMSIPFCFKSPSIEYCLGFERINSDFIFTCSYMDADPEILKVPIAFIENNMMVSII